jgi:hypothetical protein
LSLNTQTSINPSSLITPRYVDVFASTFVNSTTYTFLYLPPSMSIMFTLIARNALRARQNLMRITAPSRHGHTYPPIALIPPQVRAQADPVSQKWSDDDPGHDVQGPGHGKHSKRTLASLSMDGKVCVVTGAGRGLGNMMARTFVES